MGRCVMNVTFTCRHQTGLAPTGKGHFREPVARPSFYQGFGKVVQADHGVCLGWSGIVVRRVSADCPILVDLCTGRDCLVEMDLSSRYVIADEDWHKRAHQSVVKWLMGRRIYVLTEVRRSNLDEVKAQLCQSYYQQDGRTVINPCFVGDLSPAIMAESGMKYLKGNQVQCHFSYLGRCPKVFTNWLEYGSPQACHFAACGRTSCIELKQYRHPVLTSAAGDEITGNTYKMVVPGGVAGHGPTACHSAFVVTPKGYQLPQLDRQELQREIALAKAQQARLRIRSHVRAGHLGSAGFDQKIRKIIRVEHFDPYLSTIEQKINRLMVCLERFAESVREGTDKQALGIDITSVANLLVMPVVEAEVAVVIEQIVAFEKIFTCAKGLRHLPEPVRRAGVLAMLKVVEDELDRLCRLYSDYYFANDFFHQIADTGDVFGLFYKYQQLMHESAIETRVELLAARNELNIALLGLHAKLTELLSAYREACRAPVDIGLDRDVLTSPMLLA